MPLIKNKAYARILNEKRIKKIKKEAFVNDYLPLIKHRNMKEARALIILLWASAARPIELLELKGEHIEKEQDYFLLHFKGHKGSHPRAIPLPIEDELIKEAWNYCSNILPHFYLFPHFRSQSITYKATTPLPKGIDPFNPPIKAKYKIIKRNEKYLKEYSNRYLGLSQKLKYWCTKWFELPPYYFRHNRISIAAETLDLTKLMYLKGAKSEASVLIYVQMGLSEETKKISTTLIQ